VKGQGATVVILVGLFIGMLLALAVAWPIAHDLNTDYTEAFPVTNQSLTPTANYTTTTLGDQINRNGAGVTLTNMSGTLTSVDYNTSVTAGTKTTVIGWQSITGSVNATYTYFKDAYVNDSTQRTVINQIPVLVLALLITVIAGMMVAMIGRR